MADAPTTKRPNYFDLLDLDPDEPWEPTGEQKYNAQYERKRRDWMRQGELPTQKGIDAKRYLSWLTNIKEVMESDQHRASEAEACRQARKKQQNQLRQLITEAARERAGRRSVTESQVAFWARDLGLSPEEVKKAAGVVGVVVVAEAAQKGAASAGQLDPTTVKNIRSRLDALGKADLYALLGLTSSEKTTDISATDLLARATKLNADLQGNINKTIQLTMQIELTGYAMDLFRSDDMRARYDAALRVERLEKVAHDLEQKTGGAAPSVQNIEEYLESARVETFTVDEALDILNALAVRNKWGVLHVPDELVQRLERQHPCPFCGELIDEDARVCRHCGQQLLLDCPNCGRRDISVEDAACPRCAFRTGERAWVRELIRQAEHAVREQQWLEARARVDEARALWSPKTPDELATRIADLDAEILPYEEDARRLEQERLDKERKHKQELEDEERKRQKEIRERIDRIRRAITARNLTYAGGELEGVPAAHPEHDELKQPITTGLARARTSFDLASNVGMALEERARLCQEALDACADYRSARELLKQLPPARTPAVDVTLAQNSITIAWKAAAASRVSYTVACKEGAAPTSVGDGRRIVHGISDLSAEDMAPPVGVMLYYAVFTARERVAVFSPPTVAAPVVLPRDVEDVSVEVDDHTVKLKWKKPTHVQDIIVVRTQDLPPSSHHDGTRVRLSDLGSLTDTTVANDVAYYFGIYCLFPLNTCSTGVIVRAVPQTPPLFPGALTIAGRQDAIGWWTVDLSWPEEPERAGKRHRGSQDETDRSGRQVIYRLAEPGIFAYGAKLTEAETAADIERTIDVQYGRGSDRLARPSEVFYAPCIVYQGVVYSGKPQPYLCLPEVIDLTAESHVGAAHLKWKWPPLIDEVVVVGGTAWPDDLLSASGAVRVNRARGATEGTYIYPAPVGKRLSIVVASVAHTRTRTLVGPGQRIQSQAADVADIVYEFNAPARFRGPKNYTLTLRVRNSGALRTLPPLTVRYMRDHAPAHNSDGREWISLAAQALPAPEFTLDLPTEQFSGRTFGGVFFVNAPDGREARLTPASEAKTRLA